MNSSIYFSRLSFALIALFVSSSAIAQNVGIGTAAPLDKLHVVGNIRSTTLSGVGNRFVLADPNGTLVVGATPGTTNPAWTILGNATTVPATNFLGTTDNVDFRMRTNNVERITIKNTGSIGFFTNAPVNSWLHSIPPTLVSDFQFKWDNNLNGDAPARFQSTVVTNPNRVFLGATNFSGTGFAASAVIGIALNGTNTTPTISGGEGVNGFSNSVSGIGVRAGFVGGNTAVIGWALLSNGWAGGTTPWVTISDEKIKTNVATIPNALSKVLELRGVEYNFRNEEYSKLNLTTDRQVGFIAQEVEKVIPAAVHDKGIPYDIDPITDGLTTRKGTYNLKGISYTDIIPFLVEGMKEQQQQIETLKARINQLESEKK